MAKFNHCPNCKTKPENSFDIHECKKCKTLYCYNCGNNYCPKCGSQDRSWAGKAEWRKE